MTYDEFLDEVLEKASDVNPQVFDYRRREFAKAMIAFTVGVLGMAVDKLLDIEWNKPFRRIRQIAGITLASAAVSPVIKLMIEYNMLNKAGIKIVAELIKIREKYKSLFVETNQENIPKLIETAAKELLNNVQVK